MSEPEKEIENVETILEERKEKIKNWLKDPHNLVLVGILVFLIIFRAYWFFSTLHQPLWWDEANYMNIARTWLGAEYRPVLFPLIISAFLFLRFGETSVRAFVLLCSIISVILLYGIGNLFFNKKTALFSSFILAVFWSFSFYSHRILVDVPVAMLWLTTIYLFFNAYFRNKNLKYFAIAGFFLGLSFLMKFSSVALVGIFAVYLLLTERQKIFNKKIILFYLTSLITVLPYFVWQWLSFGSPIAFFIKTTETKPHFRSFWQSLIDQVVFSFKLIHWVFLVLFIVGLFVILSYLFLLYDKIIIKKSNSNKYYFLLLWLILSLLFFAWLGYGTYMDERYYFVFYPSIFLLAGRGLSFIYDTIKKYHKGFAIVAILALLGFGAYQNILHANQIIEIKKTSFEQLKLAGTFIKRNTDPSDIILILEEPAEISYYAERNFSLINKDNETQIIEKIKRYHPKYAVLSFYYSLGNEFSREAISFVLTNSSIFKLVRSYGPYINQEKTLPLVTIFEIKY